MSMAALPTAILSYGLEDSTGSQSKMQFHVPFGTLASVVTTAAALVAPLIAATTGCAIVSQSLTYAYHDSTHATPADGSRVEDKGVVIMRAANGRPSRVAIPGVLDSLKNTSGSIDRTNADFVALFEAILGTGAVFCAADGSDLVAVDKAYQAFRRSTRGSLPTDR
jgi:hypothetical protein